jgi:hypothetical protein
MSFGNLLDERVLAVTVIPNRNSRYARERGWLGEDEAFHRETIAERLRQRVAAVAPDAEFRYELVDRNAPPGTISTKLRRIAASEDTSMLFVGSENAGRLTRSVASVGSGISADDDYDLVLVRRERHSPSPAIREIEVSIEKERDELTK